MNKFLIFEIDNIFYFRIKNKNRGWLMKAYKAMVEISST